MDERRTLKLINEEDEFSLIDFKANFYDAKDKKSRTDFVKDMLSFSNTTLEKSGYIICGVSIDNFGKKEIVGINETTYIDDNNWVTTLRSYASHPINFRFHRVLLTSCKLTVVIIEIFSEQERPILCTKGEGEKLVTGQIYFRNGSINDVAINLVTIEKMILKNEKKITKSDPTYNKYIKFPPAPYYTFIGREKEIEDVYIELINHHKHYLLSLKGDGGIGKTSIAYKVASDIKSQIDKGKGIFDEVIWISAKDQRMYFDERLKLEREFNSLDDLYNKILLVFYDIKYINEISSSEKAKYVNQALEGTRFLFVLDNLEVFDNRDMADISKFIKGVPQGHKFLLTSRHDLRVQEFIPVERLPPEKTKDYVYNVLEAYDMEQSVKGKEVIDRFPEFDKLTLGNPLYIKYFIAQIKKNRTLDDILSRRDSESEKPLKAYCFDTTLNDLKDNEHKVMNALATSASINRTHLTFNEIRYVTSIDYHQLHEMLEHLTEVSMIEKEYLNSQQHYKINSILGSYVIDERKIAPSILRDLRKKIQNIDHYNNAIKKEYKINFGLSSLNNFNQIISYNIVLELMETTLISQITDNTLSEAKTLYPGNYLIPFIRYLHKIKRTSLSKNQLHSEIHLAFTEVEDLISDTDELIMCKIWKWTLYLKIELYDEILADFDQSGIDDNNSLHKSLFFTFIAVTKSLKAKEEYDRHRFGPHNELRDNAEELFDKYYKTYNDVHYFKFLKKKILNELTNHKWHLRNERMSRDVSSYSLDPVMIKNLFE